MKPGGKAHGKTNSHSRLWSHHRDCRYRNQRQVILTSPLGTSLPRGLFMPQIRCRSLSRRMSTGKRTEEKVNESQ